MEPQKKWNIGIMEQEKDGRMEDWSVGRMGRQNDGRME
jgi:hypothetical protein